MRLPSLVVASALGIASVARAAPSPADLVAIKAYGWGEQDPATHGSSRRAPNSPTAAAR